MQQHQDNKIYEKINSNEIKEKNQGSLVEAKKVLVHKDACEGVSLSKFCFEQNLVQDKSQLKKLIEAKNILLNDCIVTEDIILDFSKDLHEENYLLIQMGKAERHLFHFSSKIQC